MKKAVGWKILIFCVLYFLFSTASYADEYNFIYGLIDKSFEFITSDNVRRTNRTIEAKPMPADSDEDYYVEYYQGKDSVAVMIPEGGDAAFAYFATKDKRFVFPGNVRIGGPIATALKPGLIPGKMEKGEEDGIVVYAWDSGTYHVLIATLHDTIQYISFMEQESFETVKIDPQLITFLP